MRNSVPVSTYNNILPLQLLNVNDLTVAATPLRDNTAKTRRMLLLEQKIVFSSEEYVVWKMIINLLNPEKPVHAVDKTAIEKSCCYKLKIYATSCRDEMWK